jgi:hypothetical protein
VVRARRRYLQQHLFACRIGLQGRTGRRGKARKDDVVVAVRVKHVKIAVVGIRRVKRQAQ